MNTDLTLLETTNIKGEVQLFKGNKLSALQPVHKKERNARNAERHERRSRSTQRQAAVTSAFGTELLDHRPARRPTSSATSGCSAIASLLDVQYSHVGNNFILDFHESG